MASSRRFRTIQDCPKDLRALSGHPDPAVSWHSGFRGGAHARPKTTAVHHASWRRRGCVAARGARGAQGTQMMQATMRVRLLQLVGACPLLTCSFVQAPAQTDTYPNKPIRIITHSAAGGAPDVMLRIVGDRLGVLLGQQVVVLNQPGAGGA